MPELPLSSILILSTGCELTHLPSDPEAAPLHAHEEGDPKEALAALFTRHPSGTRLESALPARAVLMMILSLPATDPKEIAGMVQLQAEEISPFPPERTCISWEVLEQSPPRSRILLTLCARKEVEDLKRHFASHSVVPQRIDVDVLGWLEVMTSEHILPSDSDALVLLLHGENSTVVAWNRGTPCLIRSLVQARDLSSDLLKEELMYLSLSLESGFDLAETPTLQIWHDGAAPEWINEAVEGWTFETHSLEDLPPLTLGLARRGLREAVLDLTPAEWKADEARALSKKKTLRALLSSAAVWGGLMVGFLGWAQFRQSGYRALRKENNVHASSVATVKDLVSQVRSLTQFTDRSSSALEMLLFIAKTTPGSGFMVIEDFRYEKEEGITFSGTLSGDVQPFYQFLESFGESDQVRVKDYDLKEAKSGFRFQVEAEWAWLTSETEGERP